MANYEKPILELFSKLQSACVWATGACQDVFLIRQASVHSKRREPADCTAIGYTWRNRIEVEVQKKTHSNKISKHRKSLPSISVWYFKDPLKCTISSSSGENYCDVTHTISSGFLQFLINLNILMEQLLKSIVLSLSSACELKSKEIKCALVSLYASVPWCIRYIFGLPFVSLSTTSAAVWVDLCLRLSVSFRQAKGLRDQVDVLRGCWWNQDIRLWAAGFCVPIWNTCFKLIYSTIWGNNFQPKHSINSESE